MPEGGIEGWVSGVLDSFGLLGLTMLLLIENLFPPIPSEIILPLAGFLVSRGVFSFLGALAAATVGSLLGAFVLYAIGRWGGRELILRYGRVLRIRKDDLERAEGWFDRYGSWVVFLGRLMPGIRSVVSVPAGILEMPILKFTLLTAVGSALWNTLLIGAGWFLGRNWDVVAGQVEAYQNVLLAALALGAFVILLRYARSWQRNR
jgi:membrane protein DedA with SNARE-associated domain